MDDFGTIRLSGLGGNDTLSAGTGVADVIMLGGAGDDRLTGNELNGEFFGGDNNDTIDAFGGADAVHGDAGNDTLNAGSGNDYMEGDAGDDTITGGSGADTMLGQDGNDTFFARDSTRDTLDGGPGTDRSQHDSIDSRTSIEQTIA